MRKLVVLLIVALVLRINDLEKVPHFDDINWFINSANQTLATGIVPLLGITSSVTWLHQGPLWTYFLLLPLAIGAPSQVFLIIAGVGSVALAFFAAGPVAAIILAALPFSVLQSQIPYHTSLIPLLFFISIGLISRKRPFLAGLFIGFLYLLHLLTFIYWPLFIYLLIRKKLNYASGLLGFVLGITPFILVGPLQTFGIFIWLIKQLISGFDGVSSGISTAYWIVLLPLLVFVVGKLVGLLSKIKE